MQPTHTPTRPGQSNNSTRNNTVNIPVNNTIINNQAIPSGITPAQAKTRMMMAT